MHIITAEYMKQPGDGRNKRISEHSEDINMAASVRVLFVIGYDTATGIRAIGHALRWAQRSRLKTPQSVER